MAGKRILMTAEEFGSRLSEGGSRTPDEVSITLDGRRLDSKRAVLEWWAEVGAEIELEEAARHASSRAIVAD